MAGCSLTSHLCRLSAARISLSLSLSQKSTYDERYPPPFNPLSFVLCLGGVEGCRVLSQVEDATAAASLVGILEKGEVSDGAAATCGRRNCLHLFSSPPPPVDARLGKGSEHSAFLLTTTPPSSGCIQASLSVVNRNNSGFSPWQIQNNMWCWLAKALHPPSHQL